MPQMLSRFRVVVSYPTFYSVDGAYASGNNKSFAESNKQANMILGNAIRTIWQRKMMRI
jgi:hypothetical protein